MLVDEVRAFHGSAADAARVAVRGQALGDPAHDVAGGLVLQLLHEIFLAL